ncbi:hyaluronidase-1 [Pygocentrus nattereri]|uniref:Hyaluronidase n=1 Tax=Pygocentrus nattereri TaxID=42514 RepID=A0A3B4C4E7_PYGNA|nr:hyaluronidase-1 [Pygocentrus nattereri]
MGATACWTCPLIFLCVFMTSPVLVHPLKSFSHLPFFTVWNAPTKKCESHYGVHLDLSVFDIVHNQNQTFAGNNITIFYSGKLGFYPHYDKNIAVYGGVPQNASLSEHLRKAESDIRKDIPDRDFQGLAVVDWESWRPLWVRNWGSKEVYWQGSKALVKAKHPDWNPEQIDKEARKDFERAAQAFMEETLKLGERERPEGLWGFYGFPCCYNYQYKKNQTYTGECPPLEMKRNNMLAWLWNVSTALYPDIYLDLMLRDRNQDILLYSRYRILEGLRVRNQATHIKPPVIPYARIVYTYSLEFLSQEALVNTLGESVALGAAGIVLWGDASYSESKATCQAVKDYLDSTLGRYVVNVTEAASICSRTLCSSQGRCQRRDSGSGAYLHLDPAEWTIIRRADLPDGASGGPPYVVQRRVMRDKRESNRFREMFKCQCFPGWEGEHCQKPVDGWL